MSVQPTEYLTKGYPDELERQIASSVPGMAFFAASGPFGTSCAQCISFGYSRVIRNKAGDAVRTVFQRNRCAKFCELTGLYGGPIPPETESCKYFEAKK
jgi:hypothetical protein